MAIKIQGTDVVNDNRELKNITNADNIIQQPVNQSPADNTTDIGASSKSLTLQLSNYANLYGAQNEIVFQIADPESTTYITETKVITVASGELYEGDGSTGNVFYIDGIENPPLTLKRGNTYIFDQSDASNDGHPLRFQFTDGSSFSQGVTVNGTPGTSGANVTFTVPFESPDDLEYYCNIHGIGMGGPIAVENISNIFDDQNLVFTVSNITSTANSHTINDIRTYLSESSTYFWRGRYIDNNGIKSLFSEPTTFTVADTIVSVETPTITSPSDGATSVSETPTITSSAFNITGASDTHVSSDWQIATDAGFTNVIFESLDDTSNLESITVPSGTLLTDTQHYVRVRHTGATYGDSAYSDDIAFTTSTSFVSVATPTITSPSDGATSVSETPTITSSAFSVNGGSDTHASSDWQIATDTSFNSIAIESLDDTSNLESFTVPSGTLFENTVYYVRVRHRGSSLGDSDYSPIVQFTSAQSFPGEVIFDSPGNYTWTPPSNVTSVNAVCIGAGGASLGPSGGTASFDTFLSATGGGSGPGGSGGSFSGADGGGSGGSGGTDEQQSGGGGAGGYSGNGGDGGQYNEFGDDGLGGGGGGGGAGSYGGGGGGGGVGYYVEGDSGSGGDNDQSQQYSNVWYGAGGGRGGSGGSSGGGAYFAPYSYGSYSGNGGTYGGGGRSSGGAGLGWKNNISVSSSNSYNITVPSGVEGDIGGDGRQGAVRIIWGSGRSFPNNSDQV